MIDVNLDSLYTTYFVFYVDKKGGFSKSIREVRLLGFRDTAKARSTYIAYHAEKGIIEANKTKKDNGFEITELDEGSVNVARMAYLGTLSPFMREAHDVIIVERPKKKIPEGILLTAHDLRLLQQNCDKMYHHEDVNALRRKQGLD